MHSRYCVGSPLGVGDVLKQEIRKKIPDVKDDRSGIKDYEEFWEMMYQVPCDFFLAGAFHCFDQDLIFALPDIIVDGSRAMLRFSGEDFESVVGLFPMEVE